MQDELMSVEKAVICAEKLTAASTTSIRLAKKGLETPDEVTPAEIREICGAVLAHIERCKRESERAPLG